MRLEAATISAFLYYCQVKSYGLQAAISTNDVLMLTVLKVCGDETMICIVRLLYFLMPFQDKILQSFSKNEEIQVTNDGATILKSIGVDNPAAKILVGKNSKYFYMDYNSL